MGRKKYEGKPITVMLDAALLKRIDEVAKLTGEGRSTVMRLAMRFGLAAIERMMDRGEELAESLAPAKYPSHREQFSIVEDQVAKKGKTK